MAIEVRTIHRKQGPFARALFPVNFLIQLAAPVRALRAQNRTQLGTPATAATGPTAPHTRRRFSGARGGVRLFAPSAPTRTQWGTPVTGATGATTPHTNTSVSGSARLFAPAAPASSSSSSSESSSEDPAPPAGPACPSSPAGFRVSGGGQRRRAAAEGLGSS